MLKILLMILILMSHPTKAVLQASLDGVEFTYDGERLERILIRHHARDCIWCSVPECRELMVIDDHCVVLRGGTEIGVVTYHENQEARFQKLDSVKPFYSAFRVASLLFVIADSRLHVQIFALPSCERIENTCLLSEYRGATINVGQEGAESVDFAGRHYSVDYPIRHDKEEDQFQQLSFFVEKNPFIKRVVWTPNLGEYNRPKFRSFLSQFEDMAALCKSEVFSYLRLEEELAFLSLTPNSSYFKSCHWKTQRGEIYYELCLHLWRGEMDKAKELFQGLLSVGDCNAFALRNVGLEEKLHHQEMKEVIETGRLSIILSPEIDWLGAAVHQPDAQQMINFFYEDSLNRTLYCFFIDAYFHRFKAANKLFKELVANGNPYTLALMHLVFREGRWGVDKSPILAEAFLKGADPQTIKGFSRLGKAKLDR